MDPSTGRSGSPDYSVLHSVSSFSSSKPRARPLEAVAPTSDRVNSLDSPSKRQKTVSKSMLHFHQVAKTSRDSDSSSETHSKVYDPYRATHYMTLSEHRSEFSPEKFFCEFWVRLEGALEIVFRSENLVASVQDLYVGIENVCRQGNSEALYQNLVQYCENCILRHQKQLLDENQSAFASGSPLDVLSVLQQVLKLWREWRSRVSVVSSIFAFLDQFYAFRNSCPLVLDVGVDHFRRHIFSVPKIQSCVIDGACEMVRQHRLGREDVTDLFKTTTGMFRDLSVYADIFEPAFLGVSQEFIRSWVEQNTRPFSLLEYTKGALKLIEEEVHRCEVLDLSTSSRWELVSLLDKHLIVHQQSLLVNYTDFGRFLDEDRAGDLRNLYTLLKRVKLESELAPLLTQWIEEAGNPIVLRPENQSTMVYLLVSMKTKLDTIWEKCFDKDTAIGSHITAAFTKVVNSRPKNKHGRPLTSKLPEMISKYFDFVLKGGTPVFPERVTRPQAGDTAVAPHGEIIKPNVADKSEEEDVKLLGYLQEGFDVFRYLEGKSSMERIYRADLARRLLLSRKSNSKAEQHVLNKFKSECGDSFIEAMDLMFQDITKARAEITAQQQPHTSTNRPRRPNVAARNGVDFTAMVLSSAAWPTYPDVEVKLPPGLQAQHDEYEKEYKEANSNRTVSWKHGLAQCVVKGHFPLGNKELLVTGFQALVLLQFSEVADGEEVPYTRIQENTGLPDAELKRTLQSLASAKIRPLTKHPRGREVSGSDRFSINQAFTHERYRVKISQIQHREGGDSPAGAGAGAGADPDGMDTDRDSESEGESEDRLMELQSMIMKILKVKKVLPKADLIAQTIEAVKTQAATEERVVRALDKLYERDLLGKQPDGQYCWDIK